MKVVSVMTGAVSSRTLDTAKDFKLPPNSVYSSIEDTVAARARGEDGIPRMTPQQYAEKVVKEVLGGTNRQIWKGGYASSVKFMSNWFPISLWVRYDPSLDTSQSYRNSDVIARITWQQRGRDWTMERL